MRTRRIISRILRVTLLSVPLLSLALASDAWCAEKAPTILHRTITAKDLPQPQNKVVLRMGLEQFQDLAADAKAIVVSDGRLLELSPSRSYFNTHNVAVFEFEVPAPIAELRYQFFIPLAQDKFAASARYAVRRECMPSLTVASSETPHLIDSAAQAQSLVKQSSDIDEELKQYDRLQRNLDELRKLIKE